MRRLAVCGALLFACTRGAQPGSPDPVPPSIGPVDSGAPDSGTLDSGTPDSGTPDSGVPDAGPTVDAHRIGGLGAGKWPTAPVTIYGFAQGLLEAPISASTDEGENIWVVSEKALYLLQPGGHTFRRYTAQDGLHLGPGWTEPPDVTLVVGGQPGECFIGYYAHDTFDPPNTHPQFAHTVNDPVAHLGKMDQVLLRENGTLEVRRYDFKNSNDPFYFETRTVMSAVYDHFQHPGNLYVGSNHGVTRIVPGKWREPKTSSEKADPHSVELEWYADHIHPWVCFGGCWDEKHNISFGDQFGLTLADDGRLWMGGLTTAGAVHFKEDLKEWVKSWAPYNPFDPAFGDPYPGNPPVFNPPAEGDYVNIRAVAAAKDGTVWFASGEVEGWRGTTYGLASWNGGNRFTHVDPTAIGAVEYNLLELVAWPDGRLVLGFPSSGLLVWKPGDPRGTRLTMRDGLPGERIGRLYLDRMVNPPALYVPTEGGLAVFRSLP